MIYQDVAAEQPDSNHENEAANVHRKTQEYLSTLGQNLASHQNLPKGMSITIHYVNSDVVNAFATLGGHIFIHRGLLEKIPHENALAMVIAHEIAHIKYRDPILSASRGLTIGLALALLTGGADSPVAQQLPGNIAMLTALSFSRGQEEKADDEALETLVSYYGHVAGASALFEVLQEEHGASEPPVFLSSHPVTEARINNIRGYDKRYSVAVDLTPLPDFLAGK